VQLTFRAPSTSGRGSEAAMVGGLADWFAVTALFRRPLGLPIPHTAIIPAKKDQIGEGLAGFVQQYFLTTEIVSERVAAAQVPRRVGEWLADPVHADRLAAEVASAISGLAGVLREDELRNSVAAFADRRLRELDIAPLLARLIDGIIVSLLTAPLWVVVAIRAFHRIDRVVQQYPDLNTPAAQAALKQADSKLLGAAWVIVIASGLIWFLYDWLQHAKWGQTVGKRALSIRVVSAYDRSPVSGSAAARRAATFALAPMVPFVGTFFYLLNVLWQLWDRRRQCLHDKVANTVVVRTSTPPAGQWPPPQQPW